MTDYNHTPDGEEDGKDNNPVPTPEPSTPVPGDGNSAPVPSPAEPKSDDQADSNDHGGNDNPDNHKG